MFGRKSVYIVTGPSKGLGKSIVNNFAGKASKDSVFVFLSRNVAGLKELETEIQLKYPDLKLVSCAFNQGDLNEIESTCEKVFKDNNLTTGSFEQAVIVHNAGTLGDNSKFIKDLNNTEELNTYFNVNLTGPMLLNTAFQKFFQPDLFKYRYVINISSLTAVKAFKSFALYCTGKAARDMFFQVLAEEEPSIRVLSYAPGPCETDMQTQCREKTIDPEVKQMFQSMLDEGKILDCDVSIQKLIKLLEVDKFVSGAHIDYFDVE